MIFLSPLALLFGWRLLVDGDGRHRLQPPQRRAGKSNLFCKMAGGSSEVREIHSHNENLEMIIELQSTIKNIKRYRERITLKYLY